MHKEAINSIFFISKSLYVSGTTVLFLAVPQEIIDTEEAWNCIPKDGWYNASLILIKINTNR